MRSTPCLPEGLTPVVAPTSSLLGPAPSPEQLTAWRQQLNSGFAQVADVFEDCLREAHALLSPEGLNHYLEAARFLGKMGRGVEPLLVFLQAWPPVARSAGESALPVLMDTIRVIWKSPNGKAFSVSIVRRILSHSKRAA